MKTILLMTLILMILLPGVNARALDHLENEIVTFAFIQTIDFIQTLEILERNDLREMNRILDKNSDDFSVLTYFVSTTIVVYAFTKTCGNNWLSRTFMDSLVASAKKNIEDNRDVFRGHGRPDGMWFIINLSGTF